MEPDSETIICDNSMRLSEKTFIRMITSYDYEDHENVTATGLPIAEGKSEILINHLITVV
jgi:hypothetical protein